MGVGVGCGDGRGYCNVMRAGAPVSVACGARARVIVCGGFERVSGAAKLQMHRFVGRRSFSFYYVVSRAAYRLRQLY